MPKTFGFRKTLHHCLMGAGAVLHPILMRPPADPAAHDARALERDLAVVGQDMWAAIAAFEAADESSSRSNHAQQTEQNADDSSGQA